MKYGIISDIHSNLEAFEEVLSYLEGKVQQIICLGDIVGYNPSPNECCNLVKINDFPCVAGNHDCAVTNKIDADYFNSYAKAAVSWTRSVLTSDNFKFLEKLPLRLEFDDFEIVHGSLRDPVVEYITNLDIARATFELMKKPLCFVGHSHVPAIIFIEDDEIDGFSINGEANFSIKDNKKTIFNVGAVGQPRDRNPRAACAIYDSDKKKISLRRVSYDIEKTQNKMWDVGLPAPLIDRLKMGR